MKFVCSCGLEHTVTVSKKNALRKIKAPSIPREALTAILSTYCEVKGYTFGSNSYMIYGKPAKELYKIAGEDVPKAQAVIKACKKYAEDNNWSDWSLHAVIKHYDAINKPIKSQYGGWS